MKVKMKLKIKYKGFFYIHSESPATVVTEKPIQRPAFKIPSFIPVLKPALVRI